MQKQLMLPMLYWMVFHCFYDLTHVALEAFEAKVMDFLDMELHIICDCM